MLALPNGIGRVRICREMTLEELTNMKTMSNTIDSLASKVGFRALHG
jgi:hypothetical protein